MIISNYIYIRTNNAPQYSSNTSPRHHSIGIMSYTSHLMSFISHFNLLIFACLFLFIYIKYYSSYLL